MQIEEFPLKTKFFYSYIITISFSSFKDIVSPLSPVFPLSKSINISFSDLKSHNNFILLIFKSKGKGFDIMKLTYIFLLRFI